MRIMSILFFCTLAVAISISVASGQEKVSSLEDVKVTMRMEKQSLGTIFRYLMENYDVPIGFEQSTLDRNHSEYSFLTNLPSIGRKQMESDKGNVKIKIEAERIFDAKRYPITVNVDNGKLRDVFDQVVRQMTNYTWEVNDGVVNIFPTQGRDVRFKNLMETDVKKFNMSKGNTVNDVTFKILGLPEFRQWLNKNNLHFNPARTGSSIILSAQYGRTIDNDMNFANMKFRDLLNSITKNKRGAWFLKWRSISQTGDEHIDLDI